ncbi:BTB And C-terminal Kelch [Sparganum proliferum]
MALSHAEIFEDTYPLIRSCPALNKIHLAGDIKDLTIEVKDGNVLHADRIILAARIPSLRAALSGPLGEENSVLRWPTMPLSLANAFIQYVYTGRVEVTDGNARGMVTLAKMLKMPHLVDWGVAYMVKGVTLENLPATWDFARSMNVEVLTKKCIGLMKAHFENFVPTEVFVRLPAETLLTVLRGSDLSVGSEEEVVDAIARWVGADAGLADDKRLKVHAPTMLKEVQWHLTTVEYRNHLLENYQIFKKGPECPCLMFQISNWIGDADKDKRHCPFNVRTRLRQSIFLFGRDNDDKDGWSVLRVDPQLQQAERVADMKANRSWASYSVVGASIFVVGGGNASRDVDEFLMREGRWRERAPLAVGRQEHAAAVVRIPAAADANGEEALIGVFGGLGGEDSQLEPISSCEVYDVRQDRWLKLPNLPEKRWGPAAACLSGDRRVFVIGGWDASFTALASVVFCHLRADWERQATTADFWLKAAPMRTARRGLAATPFRGAILVAGGVDDRTLNTVEMFSPPDARNPLGQWTELASMQEPRCRFTLLTSTNAVFALGSTVEALTTPGGSDYFNSDLTSWVWSSTTPVESLRRIHGAGSIRM